MSRIKMKEYQNSYAFHMQPYGLQRGIEGSETRHISTSQYYRDILIQTENVQKNINNLLAQQAQSQQELTKIKSGIKIEKLKSSAVDVATVAIETVGSVFSTSKAKKQQLEVDGLKAKNTKLTTEIKQLNEHIRSMEATHNRNSEKLRQELKKIYDLFPDIREMLRMESLCRQIGFSEGTIRKLLNMNSIDFEGEIYSEEHHRRFETKHSSARIEKDPSQLNKLGLAIDGLDIVDWFKVKYREFQKSIGINVKKQHNRGMGL